jgi:hypothetical protein
VKTKNVHTFSVKGLSSIERVSVDGSAISILSQLSQQFDSQSEVWVCFIEGSWKVRNLLVAALDLHHFQRAGVV